MAYKKYNVDETFFESIDSEAKAYILGFIAADGCIHGTGKSFDITISEQDYDVLQDIRQALKYTGKIAVVKRQRTNLVRLCISNKSLVKQLNSLGFTNAKSKVIRYPVIPSEMDRHFIRGVWDGDGWIGKSQGCVVSGSKLFLEDIQGIIAKHGFSNLRIESSNNAWRLVLNRRNILFIQWLYSNCDYYLARKHFAVIQFWS